MGEHMCGFIYPQYASTFTDYHNLLSLIPIADSFISFIKEMKCSGYLCCVLEGFFFFFFLNGAIHLMYQKRRLCSKQGTLEKF